MGFRVKLHGSNPKPLMSALGQKRTSLTAVQLDLFIRSLFQPIADLVETRVGTAIVKFGAGCAGRADGADDLVAKLDYHSTTEKHNVRQQGKCIVFERNGGVCFIVGAIERVNASAVAT